MSRIKQILKIITSEDSLVHLKEFINLDNEDTGLSTGIIYISTKYLYDTKNIDNARIKYSPDSTTNFKISISISDNPLVFEGDENCVPNKNLEELYNWIILNKDKLLDYWEKGNEYITTDFISNLKKI